MPTETEKRLAKKAVQREVDELSTALSVNHAKLTERDMHQPRDLRKMLFDIELSISKYPTDDAFVNRLTETFKHFLMDCQHERRMARDLEAQKVIQTIIDRIK